MPEERTFVFYHSLNERIYDLIIDYYLFLLSNETEYNILTLNLYVNCSLNCVKYCLHIQINAINHKKQQQLDGALFLHTNF